MRRRLWIFVLLLGLLTVSVSAAESGDFTYEVLDEGSCTVTGYTGTETSLVIPDELDGYAVQCIETGAFQGNTTLEEVTLPEGLVTIYTSAFKNCTSLTKVVLPDSITEMAADAFLNCTSLREVNFPAGWYNVMNTSNGYSYGATHNSYRSPFYGCTALETITVPEGVTAIPNNAFRGLSSLKQVILPNTLEKIGEVSFRDCTSLSEITFPSAIKGLGVACFAGCTSLTEVELPASLTEVADEWFSDCTALETVTVGGLTVIPTEMFLNCTSLTEVTLPDGLMTIYTSAFKNCTSLTKVVLPDSITEMAADAFLNCTSLREVNFPAGWYNVMNTSNGYSYGATHNSYRSPFYGCTALETITVPEGVTAIPNNAFRGLSSLKQITLPNTLEKIGEVSFRDCTSLSEITFPSAIKGLGVACFAGCTSLTEVELPASLTEVADEWFSDCTALETVTVGGLTVIPTKMFLNCTSLTEVTLPDGLMTIYTSAFKNCTSLTTVTLPDSITEMAADAFLNCTSLREVNFPAGWYNVMNTSNGYSYGATHNSYRSPFYGCTALETITVAEGVTAIPNNAFRGLSSLKQVILPNTLEKIGEVSFRDCTGLERIVLPAGVESINQNTFSECSSDLVFYLPREDCATAITLLDLEIAYEAGVYGVYGAMDRHLDRENSRYLMTYGGVTMSGYLPLKVDYSLEETAANQASNLTMTFRIPSAETVADMTLKVDGVLADYTQNNGYVSVPLDQVSGKVEFAIVPTDTTYLMSYAMLSYELNGETIREVIDIVNLAEDVLTMQVPSETRTTAISVSGSAEPGQTVTLLVDGVQAATATASRTGNYSAVVLLSDPVENEFYRVEAQITTGTGSVVTVVSHVKYAPSAVAVTEFKMLYRGRTYDILALDGTRPVVALLGGKRSFRVSFDDNSRVENVRVVGTAGNKQEVVPCVYDETEDCYVGAGFSPFYGPNEIKVQYQEKEPNFLEGAAVSVVGTYSDGNKRGHEVELTTADGAATFRYLEELETGVQAPASEEYVQETSGGKLCYATQEPVIYEHNGGCFLVEEIYTPQEDGNYTVVRSGIGLYEGMAGVETASLMRTSGMEGYEDVAKATQQMLEFLTDDKKKSDEEDGPSDDDVAREAIREYVEKAKEHVEPGSEEYYELQEIEVYLWWDDTLHHTKQTYNDIRDYIDKSYQVSDDPDDWYVDRTKEEIDNGIDRIDDITQRIKSANIRKIIKKLIERKEVDGEEKSLLERIQEIIERQYKEEKKRLKARYVIDPSGYVYEAVDSNRVSGVTATIYYTENVDAPDPILWDAAGYDQENPLITDELGWYAWDVPEGWWQVKYEKEGYETAYSEWLPVPPPQLDMNVGLTTTSAPLVEGVYAYENAVDVIFSQYMVLTACDAVSLSCGGVQLTGVWTPVDAEESPADPTVSYATTFRFTPEQPLSGTVVCSVDGAENYAGIAMVAAGQVVPVLLEIKQVTAPETMEVGWRKVNEIILEAQPAAAAAGKTVVVTSSDFNVASVPTVAVFDTDGIARIPVQGLLPGEVEVHYAVKGTQLSGTVGVQIKTRGGPGESVIRNTLQAQCSGETVAFQVVYEKTVDAVIVAARYNGSGQLLEVATKPVELQAGKELSDAVTFDIAPGTEDKVRLFLLNSQTHAPLLRQVEP